MQRSGTFLNTYVEGLADADMQEELPIDQTGLPEPVATSAGSDGDSIPFGGRSVLRGVATLTHNRHSPPRRRLGLGHRCVPSTAYPGMGLPACSRDRLHQRTGHPVHYMAHNRVACYCPSCGVGTLTLTFIDADPPRVMVSSPGMPGTARSNAPRPRSWTALS